MTVRIFERTTSSDIIARARTSIAAASVLEGAAAQARQATRESFNNVRERRVWQDLRVMPIDRVKDVTAGRLRLGVLQQYGFTTITDVLSADPARLQSIPGVGEATARQVYAAADQIRQAVRDSMRVRIDLDPNDAATSGLLRAIKTWEAISLETAHLPAARAMAEAMTQACEEAAPAAAGSLRRLFYGATRKAAANSAVGSLAEMLHAQQWKDVEAAVSRAEAALKTPPDDHWLWADFERRSAIYYGLLARLVDLGLDVSASDGFLPTEIVQRVKAQALDESRLRTALRGYQSFGARFALVQRRVIIGDEMGLGKTLEAIAAMAHLASTGSTHFLVVCPASVLINWGREVSSHSHLVPLTLHGPDRNRVATRWRQRGGIGVTTFETLSALHLEGVAIAMVVVDEAHYAKNPQAKRSQAVRAVTRSAERVLFMSGTPMENRVDEFRELVSYLRPDVAGQIDGRHGVAGADAFRRAVAPVYLRRNQKDVLIELPDLIQVDEWESFGAREAEAYRVAVAEGNFMAMRRAASVIEGSTKLRRLVELVQEAHANGLRVVVFSYFRDVINVVAGHLGGLAHGPITGSTSPEQRQRIVDAFSASAQPGVLVAQIEAGGVGLNIQAASVVILCEPQVKPSTEVQAIARAHRMGQVRNVQVHRLLLAHSVDQRMVEILRSKQVLFDAYVRKSDIASASPDAIDVSEASLARTIVSLEQERLALAAIGAASG